MFTLATAIEMGMNPNITINCNSPLTWKIPGQEDYVAQNYGNESMGYISLAAARPRVRPTPATCRWQRQSATRTSSPCARSLGIDTAYMPDVLSMTLGYRQLNTVEMASAYAAFERWLLSRPRRDHRDTCPRRQNHLQARRRCPAGHEHAGWPSAVTMCSRASSPTARASWATHT